jgi:hypothetical protein
MPHPHRRWEGCRGDPWVNDVPAPARARGHAPVDTAGNGVQGLRPWLGETRVTWRKLPGFTSNALRSLWGLGRPRLTARWTRRPGQRRDGATSAGPAPRHERGQGLRGPPPSRADGRCGGTAGGPPGRAPSGHGASGGVSGRASRLQGAYNPMAQGRRRPGTEGGRVGVRSHAYPLLRTATGEPDAVPGCAAETRCCMPGTTRRGAEEDLWAIQLTGCRKTHGTRACWTSRRPSKTLTEPSCEARVLWCKLDCLNPPLQRCKRTRTATAS